MVLWFYTLFTSDDFTLIPFFLRPTIGVAVFLLLFQLFLAHFVFRDRTYPNITVAIDNRYTCRACSMFFTKQRFSSGYRQLNQNQSTQSKNSFSYSHGHQLKFSCALHFSYMRKCGQITKQTFCYISSCIPTRFC